MMTSADQIVSALLSSQNLHSHICKHTGTYLLDPKISLCKILNTSTESQMYCFEKEHSEATMFFFLICLSDSVEPGVKARGREPPAARLC